MATPAPHPIAVMPVNDFRHVQGPLTVSVFGDLHLGSPHCDQALFEQHLAEVLADPAHLAVFVGDLFQVDTKREKHAGVYEQTLTLDGAIDVLETLLTPLAAAKQIGAVLRGNHDERAYHQVGIDPVAQLCARLRIADRYARDGCFLRTRHGRATYSRASNGQPRPIEYTGFLSHGTGNGAGSLSAERIITGFVADWYGLGHTHAPLATVPRRHSLHLPTHTVQEQEMRVLVTGSYQRYSDYALARRLVPRGLGRVRLILADGVKGMEVRL